MKAILLKDFGSIDQLYEAEIDKPSIAEHQVLIRTEVISINPIDAKTRAGKGQAQRIKDQLPAILGWDLAGTVVGTGSGVKLLKKGDAVFGQVNFPGPGGCYAEYVAADENHLAIKPQSVSWQNAAAASLAALTAWQAIDRYGKVGKHSKVLIHAAAGGVGHFAVQFCKWLGAHVTGTSSAANKDFVMQLGADEHIDYKAGPFEEKITGVDFVLDSIGGDNIDRSLKVMKPGGVIVSLPSGISESVGDKAKAAGMIGYKIMVEPSRKDITLIASLLEQKILVPHIFKNYRFDQIPETHRQIESGTTVGKIVVTIN